MRLTAWKHLRVADPIAKLAKGQALAAKDLLGVQRLHAEAVLAAVLELGLLLGRRTLLRRRAGERALVVLARAAEGLDLVAVIRPHTRNSLLWLQHLVQAMSMTRPTLTSPRKPQLQVTTDMLYVLSGTGRAGNRAF